MAYFYLLFMVYPIIPPFPSEEGKKNSLTLLKMVGHPNSSWSSHRKVFLEISQNSQGNTCAGVSFLTCNLIKKETLAQVFSCEFCEISKNISGRLLLAYQGFSRVKNLTKYGFFLDITFLKDFHIYFHSQIKIIHKNYT